MFLRHLLRDLPKEIEVIRFFRHHAWRVILFVLDSQSSVSDYGRVLDYFLSYPAGH